MKLIWKTQWCTVKKNALKIIWKHQWWNVKKCVLKIIWKTQWWNVREPKGKKMDHQKCIQTLSLELLSGWFMVKILSWTIITCFYLLKQLATLPFWYVTWVTLRIFENDKSKNEWLSKLLLGVNSSRGSWCLRYPLVREWLLVHLCSVNSSYKGLIAWN